MIRYWSRWGRMRRAIFLHQFQLDARKGLASSFEKDVYIAMR